MWVLVAVVATAVAVVHIRDAGTASRMDSAVAVSIAAAIAVTSHTQRP
jgi:hypothetical protein